MLPYQKVKRYLRGKIERGKPGCLLPSENEMCRRFKVSRITVQRAWKELEEAPVFKKQGKGVYLLPQAPVSKQKSLLVVYPPGYHPEDDFLFPVLKSLLAELKPEYDSFLLTSSSRMGSRKFQTTDGIFWVAPSLKEYTLLEEIRMNGLPLIVINRVLRHTSLSFVSTDHQLGGERGTQYLLNRGHKRIGFVGLLEGNSCCLQRYEGYRKALHAAGIDWVSGLAVSAQWERNKQLMANSFQAGLSALIERHRLTALFISGSFFISPSLKVLEKEKIVPGKDMALVSFDEPEEEGTRQVFLARIIQPLERIGEIAAEGMKQLITGGKNRVRVLLPPILREVADGRRN